MEREDGGAERLKTITADEIVAAIERGVRWDKKEVDQIVMQVVLTTDGMNFPNHGKSLKAALLNADVNLVRKVYADALSARKDHGHE